MTNWLLEPLYWNWLLLGVVLMIAEALLPGMFVLWMGIAALAVGAIVFVFPALDPRLQWLFFAVFTVASLTLWRLYIKQHPYESESPLLNLRGKQYVGRVFTLEVPVVNGFGKVRVDDSTWKVEAQDCPAGTRVRIVDVDGAVLKGKIEN